MMMVVGLMSATFIVAQESCRFLPVMVRDLQQLGAGTSTSGILTTLYVKRCAAADGGGVETKAENPVQKLMAARLHMPNSTSFPGAWSWEFSPKVGARTPLHAPATFLEMGRCFVLTVIWPMDF
jgi:hypothetical protein